MNNPLDISKMYGLENKNNPYNNTKGMVLNQTINQYAMPSKTASTLSTNETMYNPKKPNTVNQISVAHQKHNTIADNHRSDYNNSTAQCPLIKNKDEDNTENSPMPYPTKNISYTNPYIASNNSNIKPQNQITHNQSQNTSKSNILTPSTVTGNFSAPHSSDTTTMATNKINTNQISDSIAVQDLQCMNSFLRTQTGKKAQVEFRDDYSITIKYGYLVAVGENYIVLQEFNSDNLLVCDNNDIKFITLCN